MAKGIIYVMSTAVDGLVKIGKTQDFEKRMTQHESNGYRNVAGLKRQFAIEVENYDEIEVLLQDIFGKSRVGNTELFSLDINIVIQLLSSMSGKQIYPVNETREEVFVKATEAVESGKIPDGFYTFSRKVKKAGFTVGGTLKVEQGRFILLKGATVAGDYERITVPSWHAFRKNLVLDKSNKTIEDLEASSPSMIATILCGHHTNGWDAWKNSSHQPIDVYRKQTTLSDDE